MPNRLLGFAGDARPLSSASTLTDKQLKRIHYLVEIDTSLRLARDQELARHWLTLKDRGSLQGDSPLAHMVRHGIPGFAFVRRLADGLANE